MSEEKKRFNGSSKEEKTEVHHGTFNLLDYIKDYRGHTKIRRLVFIGRRCPDVRLAAFRGALSELKKGRNLDLYTSTVSEARELLGERLGEKWGYDKEWYESSRREYHQEESALDSKVAAHRREEDSNEEILEALKKHIEFLLESGSFREAQMKIRETSDYARTVDQKLYTRLAEVENAVQMDLNDSRVTLHIPLPQAWSRRLEMEFGSKKKVQAKIRVASGLYSLKHSNFETAAREFAMVPFELDSPRMISKRDVALYGTLCAMASFRRAQLQANLLRSGEFNKFMALVPGLTEMVQMFVQCKFRAAFEFLEKLKPDIQLDYYLARHQKKLYEKIQELAIVQYFAPFSHARISRMAEVFGISEKEMRARLVRLIGRGLMNARIDNFKKVVVSKEKNMRIQTYEKALEVGTAYVRDLKTLLMKMSLTAHDHSIAYNFDRNPEDSKREDITVL